MGRSPAPATYQLIERRKGTLFLPLVGRSFCCLLSSRSGEFRVDPARILVRCLIQCNSPVYYSRVRAVEKVVFFFLAGDRSVVLLAGKAIERSRCFVFLLFFFVVGALFFVYRANLTSLKFDYCDWSWSCWKIELELELLKI
jgi:hypothetical protein